MTNLPPLSSDSPDRDPPVYPELVTIRDYIRWAFSQFRAADLYYGHGTDNAWDDAVYLVLSYLRLPLDSPPDWMDAHLTLPERHQLAKLITRRIEEHLPSAYLTQEAWFAGLPFYVDPRVIIPRSPIAELIEGAFSPWFTPPANLRILDLCTGSGCIAIACALAFPESQVDASDNCPAALEVAQLNVERHHLSTRVRLIQSDLFQAIEGKYHLIVSNPPYVSCEEYATLPREYHHEPQQALNAGEAGMAIVSALLASASDYLLPGGLLIVEVGNTQEAVMERYPTLPFLWLDFERGGEGVFLLTAEQLAAHRPGEEGA